MSFYRDLTLRALLECAVFIAAWPLFASQWWRYAVVVGGVNALRVFFGRDLTRWSRSS